MSIDQLKQDMELSEKKYQPYSLAQCKTAIKKWLLIEDEDVLDIVFAFAIAERLPGDPLWLFLIAPPGGCKTEILRAIEGDEFYHLSDLTAKTFVSGLMLGKGEERRKIDDLLPQLDKKILLFKDFTTVLEKDKDERRQIIAQMREIYDGSYSKKFGSLDEKVSYKSRFGFIAGVTPVIDKHWKIMQQLGERFLKYRWEEDEDTTTRRAGENEGKEIVMRSDLQKAIMGFLTNLSIPDVNFPKDLAEPIIQASKFLAIVRTPIVIQSTRSDFYHDHVPCPERPTRLVKQLKKLSKCLAAVRGRQICDPKDIESAIKVALSTSPPDRLVILESIQKLENTTLDGCTVAQIKHKVQLPETSIRNICEQLEMLGLVIKTSVDRQADGFRDFTKYFKLSEKASAITPSSFLEYSDKEGRDIVWDVNNITHTKCYIQNCKQTESNFDNNNVPYCRMHWQEMAN